MPKRLARYEKKRDFRKTLEPLPRRLRPGRARASAEPRFVVQKHAASRLHYDFRLEHDKVLKSWAVPKGPSLDPADKRLAVPTEDHPLDYASFEGSIPEAQYGGGSVLVWDQGTWTPQGDAGRGLRSGKLSFDLEGQKLRGGFTLLRMAGRAGKEQWLLIKKDDEHARRSGVSITELRPESVTSGRGIEELAFATASKKNAPRAAPAGRKTEKKRAKAVASKHTKGAKATKATATAALPKFVAPELATLVKGVPEGPEWLHEMKFDGYRSLCRIQEGKVRLISRTGRDWTTRFPTVAQAAKKLACASALIDGELAVLLPDGRTSFQELQQALRCEAGSVVYFAFDLLHLDGVDLRAEPLAERKALLERLLPSPRAESLRYSDHVAGGGANFFRHACQLSLEGVVSKRAASTYRSGRTKDWLKTKCSARQEFVVCGYTTLKGKAGPSAPVGALVLGVYDEDALVNVGRVGTGFDAAMRIELARKLRTLHRKTAPFAQAPSGAEVKGVRWVRPKLVAEVEFTEWTQGGRLRHPTFSGLREDKRPSQVVRERPAAPPKRRATPKSRTKARDRASSARRSSIVLSHPERVLFPDANLTKEGLLHYYESIATWILPELAGRALALVRCPEGGASTCFFQRHPGRGTPAALRRVTIRERTGPGEYLVVDSLAALASLVQIRALELHTWGSTVDALEAPDRLTFDLDPDEGLPFSRVIQAARLVKEHLEEHGLCAFVKTTGGKGLHVVAPLDRSASWDDCAAFARSLAEKLAHDEPTRYTAQVSKAKRAGKVFVDYLRNARGATTIATYSTRARGTASVSMPLSWDELGPGLRPERFTALTVPRLLRAQRAAPWRDYEEARQPLPTAKRG